MEILNSSAGGTSNTSLSPKIISSKAITVGDLPGIERLIQQGRENDQTKEASLIRTDQSGQQWGVYSRSCDASENSDFDLILNSFSMK